jgi:hypothetical protein
VSHEASLFAVIATEDDYYPDTQTIGVFTSEADALKYAAAQPRCVYSWRGTLAEQLHAEYNERLINQKRYYDYSVVPVPMSPTGDWKPRAE